MADKQPSGAALMTLELRDVSKLFRGIAAVDNVSFQARAGEITGYLGPNGSGKSTTMKLITGLLQATSGEILFDGEPIESGLIAYKQRIGYVPEEPYLYGHLSGLEYLVTVGQLRNLPATATAKRIDGLLRLFSLHGDRHLPISAYSKGMRQKVLLSAAMALSDSGAPGKDPGDSALVFTMIAQHFLIATTMLVVGLFAVLSWDATFPDRRDVMVLAPMPVRARTMFLAKAALWVRL